MPDSTMVVETSTSNCFSQKSTIDLLQGSSPIWPWAVAIRASGTMLAQPGRRLVDRLDPVVDVEHLALAQQFAPDGGADLLLLVGADEGEHRVPLLRRGRDRGHLPDAGDRHLERARDRGRGHGQHVDVGAQLLQLLLVLDAEALLLVDDDQAEVLELGLGREQPVGADDDVHATRRAAPRAPPSASLSVSKRDSARTDGELRVRSVNVAKCCCTSSVVGTSTATCLPSWTALKAARTAISVLP